MLLLNPEAKKGKGLGVGEGQQIRPDHLQQWSYFLDCVDKGEGTAEDNEIGPVKNTDAESLTQVNELFKDLKGILFFFLAQYLADLLNEQTSKWGDICSKWVSLSQIQTKLVRSHPYEFVSSLGPDGAT